MNKICLFSSYSDKPKVDNYVKFYLEILTIHFSEVIMITNEREIDDNDMEFLKTIGIKTKFVKNEGLDFGMWYKALSDINTKSYDQIAFVNDSCILFNKRSIRTFLQWVDKCEYDYCGITDSKEIKYHLQSYFTIVKKRAIPKLVEYYKQNGIINSEDSRDIIQVYELGIPQMFLKNEMKVGSYFKCSNYASNNISLMEAHLLIKADCPVIKKKLLLKNFRDHEKSYLKSHNFNFNHNYLGLIESKTKNSNLCLEYLLEF